MRSLVLVDIDNGVISDASLRVIGAALRIGKPVDLLVFDADAAQAAAQIAGIEQVLLAAFDTAPTAESLAAVLQGLSANYALIAAAHRALARGAFPRAAARAGSAFLADVTGVASDGRFVRSLYAGSVVANVASEGALTFATFRASSFAPVARDGGQATIVTLEAPRVFGNTTLIERHATQQTGQDLSSARIVVAGGRGLASKENMQRLGELADNMGAALGASRAAVDAGYAPNAVQVGQTGNTVAPDVYLAFGISGAIQHLAGMKDSKLIVAVNKDPDAPIFSIADVGLVGDLFETVGGLEARVAARSA
ncbi:electron transfer flavoprotein subunit alpha/FixB family protein [Burkholderia sp. Ac-20365]|uniref:electron transfer flavoprotein subunit alpha/FixB family protein n=1 Tax=Burkholderia sp. Ac-20365 TaxID=2703897 RepID=UPI00197CAE56|nr:electron transfer flavoprotein subunit alpha/FixB family protein [Burkholderia sp. Ac-20365]MBN3762284.1 electron transfer flavoprotein subunit alpha/FixB family protein [Burkholderia sp. Ac-20365]